MDKNKPGAPFVTVLIAVGRLGGLSFIPWGKLTKHYFKDYNLLADVMPGTVEVTAEETLDPELAEVENALSGEEEHEETSKTELKKLADSGDEEAQDRLERASLSSEVETPKDIVENKIGGIVIIEDYTTNGNGPSHLRQAVRSTQRPARIGVIGDSYIEGDILTADIRKLLQDEYGGSGVGYVPLSSNLTGFRQTVRQSCKGWTVHEIRDKGTKDSMKTLSGQYFTAGDGAKTTFKGTASYPHLDSWNKTTVLVIAPNGGSVTVGNETTELEPSPNVQAISSVGQFKSVDITSTPGVEFLGAYLDGSSGILVDNMSLRGNSGITHRNISVELADAMSKHIDYDMIIVEYGINALSSKQKDYSGYKKLMKRTIGRLREAYPNADILMLGIGDRGQKIGTNIQSVPTSQNMVSAQRDAAREMGILFWDTREAMGGEGASIEWRQKGLINPDYIHLNQKGGKELGSRFAKALIQSLK